MTEERVKYALKRLSALKDKRKFWEPYWDKAAELCSINSRIYIKDDKGRFVQKCLIRPRVPILPVLPRH